MKFIIEAGPSQIEKARQRRALTARIFALRELLLFFIVILSLCSSVFSVLHSRGEFTGEEKARLD